jgi:hypothetical protein
MAEQHHDHGHTAAGWTGVIIAIVGFCVAGGFMVAAKPVGFWAGMAIVLIGTVVGGIMKLMGLGRNDEPITRTPATTQKATESTEEESRVRAHA